MKKIILSIFPLLLFAQSINFEIGKDIDDSNRNFYALSYIINTPIKNLPTYTSLSIGGWEDPYSSSFGSISEGLSFGDNLYIKGEIGISFISNATKNLSTSFEFTEKVGIGYKSNKYSFSFNFRHFSNGGIKNQIAENAL